MSANLQELLKQCTETETGYKKISESLAAYIKDTSKNVKLQKPIVDYIKVVIKSKKHSSFQKVLCLKLLNKCINQKNMEFNRYVEKKILKRLAIFAEHNKDKNSDSDLLTKGENIFGSDEKDKKSAANFLILLLHYIQEWALVCPFADDNKSPSLFSKSYQTLQSKKIKFPSQSTNHSVKEIISREQSNGVGQQRDGGRQTLAVSSQNAFQTQAHRSQSSHGNRDSKKESNQKIAEELKRKMMKAKEISKKSEEYLARLERSGFEKYEPHEMIEMIVLLEQGKEYCEFSINNLTSESIGPMIANSEQLLDRMLKYQEQILTAIALIEPYSENIKKSEQQMYEQIQKQYQTSNQNQAQNEKASNSIKRNNSYKGGNLLLAELGNIDFGRKANPKPPQEQEEDKGDDLWANLDQFATQYNNEVLQQQQQDQSKQQNDYAFPSHGKLHLMVQQDNDPFADAIKEQQQKQQNWQQDNQNDDFFTGFNQSNQQQQQQQQQPNYDFGFNNQQQPQTSNQPLKTESEDNFQVAGKLHEIVYSQENATFKKAKLESSGQKNSNLQQYNDQSPDMQVQYIDTDGSQGNQPGLQMQSQDDQIQPKQGGGGMKLWEVDPNDFKTHSSNNDQQNNQQYDYNNNNMAVARVDDTSNLQYEVASLRRQIQDIQIQNQRLKDREEYNKGKDDSYNELSRQHRYLQSQIESQKTYYQQQIYDRDSIIMQKQDEIEQLSKVVNNMKERVNDLENKLQNAGSNNLASSSYQSSYQDNNQYATQSMAQNQVKPEKSPQKIYLRGGIKKHEQSDLHESPSNDEAYASQNLVGLGDQKKQSIDKLKESFDNSSNQQQENNAQLAENSQDLMQYADDYSTNNKQNTIPLSKSPSRTEDKQKAVSSLQQTLDNFYFRALFQDKCKIYEDVNIQIGCIRQISQEWRQAVFKIYVGNKSDSVEIQSFSVTTDSKQTNVKAVSNPILKPKEQREVQVIISGNLADKPCIIVQYQIGEKNTGEMRVRMPCNPLLFGEPFAVSNINFGKLWSYYKNKREQYFNMDLSRVANLQQLKQVITYNEKNASFIQGTDEKPNIVGFATQHSEGQVLIKIEVSATGKDCKVEVCTESGSELIQSFVDTVIDLIGAKQ